MAIDPVVDGVPLVHGIGTPRRPPPRRPPLRRLALRRLPPPRQLAR